ncbi:hypothetical protein [Mycetocola zhadangensis]|nr:hypothetical protein [Mycetocola zhadangensis]GGE91469.1 hypothetical protein GCM10011313_12890 [Mycetocola zhadangensis]
MRTPDPLPPSLGPVFSLADARALGVKRGRLEGEDLTAPFTGVRARFDDSSTTDAIRLDDFEARVRDVRTLARAYALRMRPVEFFSHHTAATLWGAPIAIPTPIAIDVCVFRGNAIPRSRGVRGHRADHRTTAMTTTRAGMRLASPASVWASLGTLPVDDLVVVGDYFCRRWRHGFLRPKAGAPPLTTRERLAAALAASRRVGAARLREALELIREDSWSPRESLCRVVLVRAGLPEPLLNMDVDGPLGFLACVDMVYPRYRIAIEYQGQVHGTRYAKDIERIEGLRAAGWIVIQVTAALLSRPEELVARVRAALVSRGWRP